MNSFKLKIRIALLVVLVLLFTGFFTFNLSGQSNFQPGICLAFDDNDLENWVELLPLFEQYDARATFFLTGVGALSEQERLWLRQIKDSGHEIGAHGEQHLSMNSHIKEFGIRDYWGKEIKENLKSFNDLGIKPQVFAYPYGEKNHYIDLFLLSQFKATRNVTAKKDPVDKLDPIFYTPGKWQKRFSSLGIGNDENVGEKDLEDVLARASNHQEVVFLHAHHIHETEKYGISRDRLTFLLETASQKGLKFFTFSEIRE